MIINIKNCSSPGASFTENTNNVILLTYEWIKENNFPCLSFRAFRSKLQMDKKINDNNNRNIFPMLKNCNFVKYYKGDDLDTKCFFTDIGLAYAKSLETIKMVNYGNYAEHKTGLVISKISDILKDLVYEGVKNILKNKSNYQFDFYNVVKYLYLFGKISKMEFAYLLYVKENNSETLFEELKNNITLYRDKKINFDVNVSVRNDLDIRDKTNSKHRNESISFLTAYTYFVGLLSQAGLLIKRDEYYEVKSDSYNKLNELMGVYNG